MKLTELRVNQVETPMGFQITPLSFSWKVTEAGEAKKQKWANVRIWKNIGQEEEEIFNSGQDENADSLDYQVNLDLAPRTRYTWQVQVAADNGETAEAASWFETGKGKEAWGGHWITADLDADTPAVLRRKFTVTGGKPVMAVKTRKAPPEILRPARRLPLRLSWLRRGRQAIWKERCSTKEWRETAAISTPDLWARRFCARR